MIHAAACFACSSRHLERWRPTLRAWRERGAVSVRAKLAAPGSALGFLPFSFAGSHGLS
jgi:uncharacterized membrane protein YbaN (DUF454 family)